VGVQFHPEFKSTPWDGHPLFNALCATLPLDPPDTSDKKASHQVASQHETVWL
jgi:GMP synthase-like glutamine amidotransferase